MGCNEPKRMEATLTTLENETMASIGVDKRGNRYVQFEDTNRQRRTLRVGRVSKRDIETVRLRIERILSAQFTGSVPDAETSRWISEIGVKLQTKLADFGLIDAKQTATLGEFIDRYKASRTDVKKSTQDLWAAPHESLRDFFGDRKALRNISRGDAREWRRVAGAGLAENTVRKYTAVAKSLFNAALEFDLIDSNPFTGLESSMVMNKERMYFVTAKQSKLVLKACPSLDWKIIFALARYGGLRCPSEVLNLKWGDVLWDRKRFIVRENKTKQRMVPIFPELAPILESSFDAAPDGSEYVVSLARSSKSNLRTTMTKIIERAGIDPWPKIFQNLRSTRETELAGQFELHVVCDWIGNSRPVAMKHYLQITDDHFDRAVDESAANALQSGAEQAGTAKKENSQTPINAESC